MLHGWILLAGMGVAAMLERARQSGKPRLLSGVVLALLLIPIVATARLAQRTVYDDAADYHNPYAYAHTAPDFMKLIRRIAEIEAVDPAGKEMYIQVIADPKETWPLPFYLRNHPRVGYWADASMVPVTPKPDLIISSAGYEPAPEDYLSEYYALRPDSLLALHIRRDRWEAFLKNRKSRFDRECPPSAPRVGLPCAPGYEVGVR
jgi:hypothetical protein